MYTGAFPTPQRGGPPRQPSMTPTKNSRAQADGVNIIIWKTGLNENKEEVVDVWARYVFLYEESHKAG